MGLGTGEIIIIAFTLVIIFSASRMGALGNSIGKFVYSFRRAAQGQDLVDVTPPKPGANEKTGRARQS